MNVDTKAIVIKKNKVSGADLLLTIYSKELGKKKIYVRGARHAKSKFLSSCELLVEGDFSLYVKPNLSNINSVYITDSHRKIRDNLSKFFLASYMLELIDKFTEHGHIDTNIYEFLSFALKCLEAEQEKYLKFFRLVFTIKLLQISGFSPEINFCTSCLGSDKLNYFSACSGGIICEQCKKLVNDSRKISKENVKLISFSLNENYVNVRQCKNINFDLSDLSDILYNFLREHVFNSKLKSFSIIDDMDL